MSRRVCPRCGGPKDFYARACRKCKRPEEWNQNLCTRGVDHPAWKGGQRFDKDGYLLTYAPTHPWPRRGGMVREHVRLMELHIGRRIEDDECVHHIDEDITNNVLENLQLLTKSEHSSHHRQQDIHRRRRDGSGRFAAREANA